jgi:hypothetical protein
MRTGPRLSRRYAAPGLLLLAACARMEPPPGGPPDASAPQLVSTTPDTFAVVPDFDGDVEFRFDEVISEGGSPNTGAGTGDLEKLVILSPTTEFPKVRWRRNRITVRPDEGWVRDRVYRVELLPGVIDLRQNRATSGAVITFTTGAPRPDKMFEGTVVDWTSARPAPQALVVALKMPDSLPYRGIADSSGRFSLGPLPAGDYVLSGVLDENRNHQADPREAFDSVRVAPGKEKGLELWAFVHDTTPPRIRAVNSTDSVSASVEFTQPLDPRQRLQVSAVRVSLLPDSTPVRVRSILPRPVDDSLNAKRPTARDSLPADTSAVAPQAPARPGARAPVRRTEEVKLTTRPALSDQLVVRPVEPWRPGGRYFFEIRGVRNVTGVAGDAVGTLVVPERPARDTLAQQADSLRPRADSLRPGADSVRTKVDSIKQPRDTTKRAAPPKPSGRKPAPTLPTPNPRR